MKNNRVITGWWDGEPIHRAMTAEELLAMNGISETAANLGIGLLKEKDYKPTF